MALLATIRKKRPQARHPEGEALLSSNIKRCNAKDSPWPLVAAVGFIASILAYGTDNDLDIVALCVATAVIGVIGCVTTACKYRGRTE